MSHPHPSDSLEVSLRCNPFTSMPFPDMSKKVYHGCAGCNHILHRDQWLLDSTTWDLQKIGAGGNGEIYRTACRETKCEHAAKFLPYSSGKRECDMAEKVKGVDTRFIVKAICSGVSRNPAACGAAGLPCVVLLFELMDGDLFDIILSHSSLADRMLGRGCVLRHIAYQLLEAMQGMCQHA